MCITSKFQEVLKVVTYAKNTQLRERNNYVVAHEQLKAIRTHAGSATYLKCVEHCQSMRRSS